MKLKICLFFLLGLTTLKVSAQDINICSQGATVPGQVHTYGDPQILTIGEHVQLLPDEEVTFPGFRVQIYNGNDRNLAQKIRTEVLQLYRDEPVYLLYEAPYFKVRVGDFRDRIEAQKMLHAMKQSYKGVLLVPDKINFPEIQ
jgi:hypothetical protein